MNANNNRNPIQTKSHFICYTKLFSLYLMSSKMTTTSPKAFKTLLIITVLGSVMSDSNMEEFCSKQYFHRIITQRNKTTNRTDIRFYRNHDTIEKRYDLWKATLVDNKDTNYSLSHISYEWQSKS